MASSGSSNNESNSSGGSSNNSTPEQIAALKNSFFNEGILDGQFLKLEDLQDETDPYFVERVLSMFFHDFIIEGIPQIYSAMSKPNKFIEVDMILIKYKGSSASFGLKKILAKVNLIRAHCKTMNVYGMKTVLDELLGNLYPPERGSMLTLRPFDGYPEAPAQMQHRKQSEGVVLFLVSELLRMFLDY